MSWIDVIKMPLYPQRVDDNIKNIQNTLTQELTRLFTEKPNMEISPEEKKLIDELIQIRMNKLIEMYKSGRLNSVRFGPEAFNR